jgi:hypothetical protein
MELYHYASSTHSQCHVIRREGNFIPSVLGLLFELLGLWNRLIIDKLNKWQGLNVWFRKPGFVNWCQIYFFRNVCATETPTYISPSMRIESKKYLNRKYIIFYLVSSISWVHLTIISTSCQAISPARALSPSSFYLVDAYLNMSILPDNGGHKSDTRSASLLCSSKRFF